MKCITHSRMLLLDCIVRHVYEFIRAFRETCKVCFIWIVDSNFFFRQTQESQPKCLQLYMNPGNVSLFLYYVEIIVCCSGVSHTETGDKRQ